MIRYRSFRNDDPPALAKLWNKGVPEVGTVRPLSPHEFDALVAAKPHFEPEGMILAEDESGNLLGFAHGGFGPVSTEGPSHAIDRQMGTIAMLVTDPALDDLTLEAELLSRTEQYLRHAGAEVIYAGGQAELNSFYWGVYGGSENSGILDDHVSFRRAVIDRGFEPVAVNVLLEADLSDSEVRDPRSAQLRRQTRVEIVDDAIPATWWESLAIGSSQITRYRVFSKDDSRLLARATTWDMTAFGRHDGLARNGLIDVEVVDGERHKGYGRFLMTEVLRHSRTHWGEAVAVQTRSTNIPALGLYESSGFHRVGQSTLYRLPGPR